ncbi:hypothetical protein [Kribbella sp. CA-293567]|uniref:hypothetical protein n=1 Tax=Kribbella sp. CA-293567 TaxID=3002436 RepID=UPI0022DD324D|nr:hypothetical protein [Kribbella sp. CA-293567]WBQ03156.1 hypothetical protein OX958_24620 [Kribbella sp. CA-293567]
MSLVGKFGTPGSIQDVPAGSPLFDRWHDVIDRLIAPSKKLSGSGAYVDPGQREFEIDATRAYTWTGFSRPLLMKHRDDRTAAFAAGEQRSTQIEYLEWRVDRDPDGVIVRVTFTTETPEYWKLLAAVAPDLVLELYRELVDPAVTAADLFDAKGNYKPLNRWNTTDGIVHYVMPINSMKDLLGVSQEVEKTGKALDGYDALPYGRETGADARINLDLWSITRKGYAVATADPPGPLMIDWDDSGWTDPGGDPVGDHWTVVRGERGAALRVVYEVPVEAGYRVGEIRIGGRPVDFGGQLAEHVIMSAHGIIDRSGR